MQAFGTHWTCNLHDDPKRLAFVLARYRLAAELIGENKRVLELGCSDGIGLSYLTNKGAIYTGVDLDQAAIKSAKTNWTQVNCSFLEADFISKIFGEFDAVLSIDVIEHIFPEHENLFFKSVLDNLTQDGICIIGTPNITAAQYASKSSQENHVNLFSADRLQSVMEKVFVNTFLFGMNDELVHTGYGPMCHYLMCMGCTKKS